MADMTKYVSNLINIKGEKIMWPIILTITFTLLSGFGDAQGFTHASKIWHDHHFDWLEALKSALGFQLGVLMFWLALRYLGQIGVVSVEIQTLLWFGVTIVGVAILSGKFVQWRMLDQFVSLGVLGGVVWLLFRTGN